MQALYYYSQSEFTQDVNAAAHSIFSSPKEKITMAMAKFDFNNVAKTCMQLSSRLAAVVAANEVFSRDSVKIVC